MATFDPAHANASTPLPPCQACGIKPPLALVLKASISNQARQSLASPPESTSGAHVSLDLNTVPKTKTGVQCPRCTFLNHASLPSCEICGLSLTSLRQNSTPPSFMYNRLEPPGPTRNDSEGATETTENLKFSFRNGGEKVFLERFRGALVQRKWLLQSAPPVPKPSSPGVSGNGRAVEGRSGLEDDTVEKRKHIGIAGLEHRGFKMRQNNEAVIGTAFEDLEALMTSAKEIIQLAESFSGQIEGQGSNGENFEAVTLLSRSVDALGLVATKDMLTSGNAKTESLYLSELSRQLAEFLTDDRRGVLHKEGGMISLVDLWAVFNRARGGVELVSPNDFEKSARLWEQLRLPVRLRQFKSGLLVVQSKEWTDDKTIAELLSWLAERHETPPMSPAQWNWQLFGQGVTAQELADRFKWSIAVATEELDMAEEKGVLCREESVEGVRFWENYFLEPIQPANTHEIA
ncbi:MAG: hypothetical protein M1814_004291 [Vezdaea aestivalis]|nr:MAG: hypothetical protein M1814_004291 [Vezdaea aestivalis]